MITQGIIQIRQPIEEIIILYEFISSGKGRYGIRVNVIMQYNGTFS